MLKKRVIATIVVRDGTVVQSIGFKRYLPVGRPEIAVEFFNQWGVDEIILLDISATALGCGPDLDMVRRAAKRCRVPLTIGGGIRTLAQARELIRSGADRLVFNQMSLHLPELLTQTADVFGSQCVVGGIDAINTPSGHRVYDYLRRQSLALSPAVLAQDLVLGGAGEIFIQSVDRDGSRQGFDLPLIKEMCAAVSVPVICCGGAGQPNHFVEVFRSTDVRAAAAANFFNYSEHSVTVTKAVLSRAGLAVRHDTHANYRQSPVDEEGRLQKKKDQVLEKMLFLRIEKEVI